MATYSRACRPGSVALSWLAIGLGGLTAAAVAIDIAMHPQHMAIMNVVWPVTGLYMPVAGWWIYRRLGRPLAADAPRTRRNRPFWLMMQIATLLGFATTYPANWLLIRAGIEHGM